MHLRLFDLDLALADDLESAHSNQILSDIIVFINNRMQWRLISMEA